MNRETLRNAITYLKIIEDMEKINTYTSTNPVWYHPDFRNNKDWNIGLTSTISQLEEWYGEEE